MKPSRDIFLLICQKLEKAKVVIIGETVILQDAIIEDNSIIVDFTGISPGSYYLCFFLNELV